jgi:hypothetical protein
MKFWDSYEQKLVDAPGPDLAFKEPEWTWRLVIGGEEGIIVRFKTLTPNRLKCFMYKFLLGWEVKVF